MKAQFINEFGKGIDPKQTMNIGKYSIDTFETVEELIEYIIQNYKEIFSVDNLKSILDYSQPSYYICDTYLYDLYNYLDYLKKYILSDFYNDDIYPNKYDVIYVNNFKYSKIPINNLLGNDINGKPWFKIKSLLISYILENIDINESSDYNHKNYLSWKRKNVTIRGVSNRVGEENNAGAMLGRGLYTAFLGNKQLAKLYGKVYFVVNAIPKHPKVFNTLNEWEIWYQNNLIFPISKAKGKTYPDVRDFTEVATIESELQKMGFDGIIIKGREIVNFAPDDTVRFFEEEYQLQQYYEDIVEK